MKSAVELLDAVFRQAKVFAASRGIILKRFFTEGVWEHIRRRVGKTDPPWMAGFGALSDLSDENRRILGIIEEEFETISPEDIA